MNKIKILIVSFCVLTTTTACSNIEISEENTTQVVMENTTEEVSAEDNTENDIGISNNEEEDEEDISEEETESGNADSDNEVETEEETNTATTQRSRDWGSEDSEVLLRIAMAEAESEGVIGKALVMMVVINRAWSESFPNTIEGVVMQSGQFTSVSDGRYYSKTPDDECYEALELVMSGWDESQGALYFESCTGGSWHERNLEFLFQYGNHKFYK